MKKINLKFGNKTLNVKGFLTINYLITLIVLFLIIQLSNKSSTFILENFIFKNQKIYVTSFASYYNKDFDKIKITPFSEIGAWIEVLDENRNVIFIKGEKKDTLMQYSQEQLLQLVSPDDYTTENPYFGSVSMVKGKNGESYIFLFKVDRRKFSCSSVYKPNFLSEKDGILSIKTYGLLYLIRILLILLGISLYSAISSKFITAPLKTFVGSIKNFKKFDYGTRAELKGLKELQEVENEFNKMVIKLEKAKDENRKIDESKKRLLVDISHDLKTPITSIQGFSKLLLEEKITPEERDKFLKIINNKAVYSAALIEDLFALSKLEDSEYTLALTELDFSEWLRRLVVEYYEEFQNKNFNLELNISEYPIMLKFDEKLMKRAISNIFNNALNHNEEHTSLRIESYLKDNNIILEIGNNGKGIDTSLGETIFEPFVKSENSNYNGSGLGLAITKKIIEKHRGSIKLTSNNVEKILFIISIPSKF